MSTTQAEAVDRRRGVARARGEGRAGPEALLPAALERLTALEQPTIRAMEALLPYGPFEPRRTAELVWEQISEWLAPAQIVDQLERLFASC